MLGTLQASLCSTAARPELVLGLASVHYEIALDCLNQLIIARNTHNVALTLNPLLSLHKLAAMAGDELLLVYLGQKYSRLPAERCHSKELNIWLLREGSVFHSNC